MAKSKFEIANPQLLLEKNKKRFVEDFWLNLGDLTTQKFPNTIGNHELFHDSPTLALLDIMRKPENFAFTAKTLFNYEVHPLQAVILQMLWNHPFSVFTASRGGGKSSLLALYALFRALFIPNSKVLFIGNAFRQSKIIFTYCENIYKNAPLLKEILSVNHNNRIIHATDMHRFNIEGSTISAIPLGDGSKIRGERSTCTLVDEYNTLNEDVFQEVVQGFSVVASSPIEKIKEKSRYKAMLELGDLSVEEFQKIRDARVGNQQIISGTCGYTFEPMYKVWKQYHDIIMSRGNEEKISRIFNGDIPPGFDYKDYAVARVPYELFPDDYMDEKVLGRAKATTHMSIYNSEYRCIFITDSDGFFRRTLLEQATAMNTKPPIAKNSCGLVEFIASLRGEKGKKYVMGIDPASEKDKLAVIILEIWPDHRRIRYCWSVNKDGHRAKLKYGLTKEHDYYSFCASKIRELMKAFDIEYIAIDAQGGGIPIMEKLGDPGTLKEGEAALYPIIEDDVDKVTDVLPGRHIIHVIQFSKAEWVCNANHSLKLDLETAELIFPMKDSLAFGLAREEDEIFKRRKVDEENPDAENYYDTLEECMMEIEELKDELVLIEHRKTPSGRDQWDTPEVKGVGHKKGRLRKDRYSALLMANAVGRTFIVRLLEAEGVDYGGGLESFKKGDDGSYDYNIGFAVRKGSRGRF